MNTYGERLKTALSARGRTRKELAAALYVSVQAIGEVIRGQTNEFTSSNNTKAARFLKVNSDWLASEIGAMEITPGSTGSPASHSRDALDLATMLDDVLNAKQRRVLYAQCVLLLSGGFEIIVSPAAVKPIDEPAPDKQTPAALRPVSRL